MLWAAAGRLTVAMRVALGTSLGLLLISPTIMGLDALPAAMSRRAPVGGETALAATDAPSKSCMSAMREVCDGKYEDLCKQCAGEHAQELLQAGCTNADIRTICQDGLLASVNLTIGHNSSDLAWQFGHINNEAPSRPAWIGLPSSVCFDSTDEPDVRTHMLVVELTKLPSLT